MSRMRWPIPAASLVKVGLALVTIGAGACADRPLYLPNAVDDLAISDLATPDFALPDFALPDFALPDFALPDLWGVPLCSQVVVGTLTGNGTPGFVDGTGGPTGTAEFSGPWGLAVDVAGNLYAADSGNNRIRKIAPDSGAATTLTGNGTPGFADGTGGALGTTELNQPTGVAVDSSGNVYVADYGNSRIRKVAPNGTTSTLAGNGSLGSMNGTGGPNGTTQFHYPFGVTVGTNGTVYVGDQEDFLVRSIAPDGTTSTLAGDGHFGFADGLNSSAEFFYPNGVAADAVGNVFVADSSNYRIRKIAGGTTSTLAGNGTYASVDGTGGTNGTAEFSEPWALTVDTVGNVYVADTMANRIRQVAPDGTTVTVAGDGSAGWRDGPGCAAQMNEPLGIAIFGKTLYVADSGSYRVRSIQLP